MAHNNSGSPPFCDYHFWQWSVATSSKLFDWKVRYLDIYPFYVYGCKCDSAPLFAAHHTGVHLLLSEMDFDS